LASTVSDVLTEMTEITVLKRS